MAVNSKYLWQCFRVRVSRKETVGNPSHGASDAVIFSVHVSELYTNCVNQPLDVSTCTEDWSFGTHKILIGIFINTGKKKHQRSVVSLPWDPVKILLFSPIYALQDFSELDLCRNKPFNKFLPHSPLLPVESIRFFFLKFKTAFPGLLGRSPSLHSFSTL